MLFHAKHASHNYSKILFSSPDTDVFIICLSVHMAITANLFFLTGVRNSRRIITVTNVAEYIFNTLKGCDVSKELLMKLLIGFHSFTGCDITSAFAGRGKVKPLKLMLNDARYLQAFAQLGQYAEINYVELQTMRSFVCHMYCCKGNYSVGQLLYRVYCQSAGKIACDHLPPCSDILDLHVMRANYQAKIWRERACCSTKVPWIH